MIVDSMTSKKLRNIMYIAACVLAAGMAQASDEDDSDSNSSETQVSEAQEAPPKKMSRYERMKARLGLGKAKEEATQKMRETQAQLEKARADLEKTKAAQKARAAIAAAQKQVDDTKTGVEDWMDQNPHVQRVRGAVSAAQTRADQARADLEDRMDKSKTFQTAKRGVGMVRHAAQSVMDKVSQKICTLNVKRLEANSARVSAQAGILKEISGKFDALAAQTRATLTKTEEDCGDKGSSLCAMTKKISQADLGRYLDFSKKLKALSDQAAQDATEAETQITGLEDKCHDAKAEAGAVDAEPTVIEAEDDGEAEPLVRRNATKTLRSRMGDDIG